MTKNGPILKTKTVLETGECTDHFSNMQNNTNLQCPVKNHPNVWGVIYKCTIRTPDQEDKGNSSVKPSCFAS